MKSNTVYLTAMVDFSIEVKGNNIHQLLIDTDNILGDLNDFVKMRLKRDDESGVTGDVHSVDVEVDAVYDEIEDELVYKKGKTTSNFEVIKGIG